MRSDSLRRARSRAFSLLEILVVFAIIVMLSVLAFAALVKRDRGSQPAPLRQGAPAATPPIPK